MTDNKNGGAFIVSESEMAQIFKAMAKTQKAFEKACERLSKMTGKPKGYWMDKCTAEANHPEMFKKGDDNVNYN